jgi:hypothetical protein
MYLDRQMYFGVGSGTNEAKYRFELPDEQWSGMDELGLQPGPNPYELAGNDLANESDPSGLDEINGAVKKVDGYLTTTVTGKVYYTSSFYTSLIGWLETPTGAGGQTHGPGNYIINTDGSRVSYNKVKTEADGYGCPGDAADWQAWMKTNNTPMTADETAWKEAREKSGVDWETASVHVTRPPDVNLASTGTDAPLGTAINVGVLSFADANKNYNCHSWTCGGGPNLPGGKLYWLNPDQFAVVLAEKWLLQSVSGNDNARTINLTGHTFLGPRIIVVWYNSVSSPIHSATITKLVLKADGTIDFDKTELSSKNGSEAFVPVSTLKLIDDKYSTPADPTTPKLFSR